MMIVKVIWILVVIRVGPRRLWFLPQAKMHPCLLLVLTRRNTHQSLTLFPMLAALPIALLLSPRYPFWICFFLCYFKLLVCFFHEKLLLLFTGYQWPIWNSRGSYDHCPCYHRFVSWLSYIHKKIFIIWRWYSDLIYFLWWNQLLRRLLMDHQARIGEVEELLPSILFPAAPELPR